MTFADLGIPPVLVDALAAGAITSPTPVQVAAIPELLAGKDAYLCAHTGTGKTLAYLLPIFCRLEPDKRQVQALILTPTHELAIQVRDHARILAERGDCGVRIQALIGGAAIKRQLVGLKEKPHIVVGSPGRIGDVLRMRKLRVHEVRTVVLDEADRLLFGDSLEDTRQVISATLRDRQLIFASATEQPESMREALRLAPTMTRIRTGGNEVNQDIQHGYIVCEERRKMRLLRGVLHALRPGRAIVFVHRNTGADDVAARLRHHGIPAAPIHSHCSSQDRKLALQAFRNGTIPVLVASDLAARGLDVQDVDLIVNLDTPAQSKAYLHRVGRTARAGKAGVAISLVSPDETWLVQRFRDDLAITLTPFHLKAGALHPDTP